MENEIWKPITLIVDSEGKEHRPIGYEVSNLGRVRSYNKRYGRNASSTGHRGLTSVPTIIKGRPDARGYIQYSLSDPTIGKRRNFRGHVLVMQAFVGPAPEGLVICHYNDIKDDNRLENLRYDTPEANRLDRRRNSS